MCPLHCPGARTLDLGLDRPVQVWEGHQQPLLLSQLHKLPFQLRDSQLQIRHHLLQTLFLPLQALQQLLGQREAQIWPAEYLLTPSGRPHPFYSPAGWRLHSHLLGLELALPLLLLALHALQLLLHVGPLGLSLVQTAPKLLTLLVQAVQLLQQGSLFGLQGLSQDGQAGKP